METLQDKEWQPLDAFGDDAPLNIKTTSSSIDGINLIEGNPKNIPYITRTDTNNGIARFVSADNLQFGEDEAGTITVGLDTQTAFFQPCKFVTGQNIQIIDSEKLNTLSSQFIVPLLRSQMKAKFNWGGNGATLGRMKRLQIMLPVDENGEPDYDFMGAYVSEKWGGLVMRYKAFLNNQLAELKHVDVPALSEKEWKPFLLSEIANCVNSTAYHSENLEFKESSKLSYVTRTANQNGIYGFVETMNDFNINPANTISFGAETAEFFYRPSDYITGNKMYYINFPQLNLFTGQFFAMCLRKSLKECFSYGNGAIPSRVMRKPVMLPATDTGEPDWDYMEQYAKNLMLKKYQQYLEFLEGQQAKADN